MEYDRERVVQQMRKWETYLTGHPMPLWEELPALELYMDQVVALLNSYLGFLPREVGMDAAVTAAAVNNYVRKKIMPPPVKKRYSRIHLAYLLMICCLKQSVGISHICRIMPLTLTEAQVQAVYDRFAVQHRAATLLFVEQVNRRAGLLLPENASAADGVNDLIVVFSAVAGLSRMAAEKLLQMQGPSPVTPADEVPPEKPEKPV